MIIGVLLIIGVYNNRTGRLPRLNSPHRECNTTRSYAPQKQRENSRGSQNHCCPSQAGYTKCKFFLKKRSRVYNYFSSFDSCFVLCTRWAPCKLEKYGCHPRRSLVSKKTMTNPKIRILEVLSPNSYPGLSLFGGELFVVFVV